MTYLPTSKKNYLAFHGLTGYLWCNNHSTYDMAKKMGISESEWGSIVEASEEIETTYSERCNATDFFKDKIKSDDDFEMYWEEIKKGREDFDFPQKTHTRMPGILRKI